MKEARGSCASGGGSLGFEGVAKAGASGDTIFVVASETFGVGIGLLVGFI